MWCQKIRKISECGVDKENKECYNTQCQRQAIKRFVGDRCKLDAYLKPWNVEIALALECAPSKNATK